MKTIIFSMAALVLIATACDENSTSSDAGFPYITVDAYYRTGVYDAVTVYVLVYNDGDTRFHCGMNGDIYVHLPETTIVYPDTTVYTPTYPPQAINIQGASIVYPETTMVIDMVFSYMHVDASSYSSIYTAFDDIIVQYGYYEYIYNGQTHHAYAFERTREFSAIDVDVTLENQHGVSHTYTLTDINGS
jgi:hypothetical protein